MKALSLIPLLLAAFTAFGQCPSVALITEDGEEMLEPLPDTIWYDTEVYHSLRAEVCKVGVKYVQFYLNGELIQREGIAPYAIAGDHAGERYNRWAPPEGFHHLEIAPYPGESYSTIITPQAAPEPVAPPEPVEGVHLEALVDEFETDNGTEIHFATDVTLTIRGRSFRLQREFRPGEVYLIIPELPELVEGEPAEN